VVILNFNGKENLGERLFSNCLASVLESDYNDFEVIFLTMDQLMAVSTLSRRNLVKTPDYRS
jgi:hypothetical protein